MQQTIAFDVYGTLIDTAGVVAQLRKLIGEDAMGFSSRWREKQLEYAFRRGLMNDYRNFAICTHDALEFTCQEQGHDLSPDDKASLLDSYRRLPAFDDAFPALQAMEQTGHRLFAFSNGKRDDVESLLQHARILEYFDDIVSVDEISSFKPDPAVYRHFLARSGGESGNSWLISGNPFDLLGALNCGMKAAWIRRSASSQFDPWGPEPTLTINSLRELNSAIASPRS
jgi:2-haloacid dehalogenase